MSLSILLIAAGLTYLFAGMPWFPNSGNAEVPTGKSLTIGVNDPYTFSNQFTIEVHWTAPHPVTLLVRTCGSNPQCPVAFQFVAQSPNSTSGSLQFIAHRGTYYAITPTGEARISYSGSTAYPFFYLALPAVVGGALLLTWALGIDAKSMPRSTIGGRVGTQGGRRSTEKLTEALEELRQQNLVVALECPSCGEPIRVSSRTETSDLFRCGGCHAELNPDDLVSLLAATFEVTEWRHSLSSPEPVNTDDES